MTWTNKPGRSVPYKLQQACFQRDQWTCQGCGYQGRQYKGDLHADHIHNRATGGPDDLDNLVTLCEACHQPKTQAEAKAGRARHLRPKRTHPSDLL
ncbi:HNH endonuclease [Mycobacterium phage TChen]|uniref:HNH endonuclease n=2 Tax=Thetabobvirus TaxID=2843467 RepID=A0A385E2A1_9CAUD|nr:HNH endonuclease [Mycobacterium phage TChen]YP_009841137.1 HNH endonuclease [Mycobacterium phage Renaud18]AWH14502.1 HNH endonuclease [Mycobacterium phage TChen]AXQ65018.1 HNH endonuclease [Mycobacterium phage Renaud18]